MNISRKGRAREHQSWRWLEEQGYSMMRAAASKGAFDLFAVGPDDVQLVQVKAKRWPMAEKMAELRAFECPPNCRRVIHRRRDRQAAPDVREL